MALVAGPGLAALSSIPPPASSGSPQQQATSQQQQATSQISLRNNFEHNASRKAILKNALAEI